MRLLHIILAFCFAASGAAAQPLKVVTSFSILADLTRQLVGDRADVEVTCIIKGTADPHLYQPRTDDAKLVAEADILILNGLDLEVGWIQKLIDSSGFKGLIVEATQGITGRKLLDPQKGQPVYDPHAWHNVEFACLYLQTIRDALIQADPEGETYYQMRTQSLFNELKQLHQWVLDQFKDIPSTERQVITTHDAFWYYGKAYGITFHAPVGVSTEAEASPTNIRALIDAIRDYDIKVVFIENVASPRLVQAIAEEANIPIGGTLYADTLLTSYQDTIRHNTRMIVSALKH